MHQYINGKNLKKQFNCPSYQIQLKKGSFNEYSPNCSGTNENTLTSMNNSLNKLNKTFSKNNPIIYKGFQNIFVPQKKNTNLNIHYSSLYNSNSHSSSDSLSPIKNDDYYCTNFNKTYYNYKNRNLIKENFNYNYNDGLSNCSDIINKTDIQINNNFKNKIFENKNKINNNWKQINHLNALNFEQCMSELVNNKYNKIKNFNNSYYLKNRTNEEDKIYDLKTIEKTLDEKYNEISNLNNFYLGNKNNDFKKSKNYNNNFSSFHSSESHEHSLQHKDNINNKKYSTNKIQKAFRQNIGIVNNARVISSFHHYPEEKINYINNKDIINNLNNDGLLEYLKKENNEIKKLNHIYKELLDNLFYFLNNISNKYSKIDDINKEMEIDNNMVQFFDFSKTLNNIDEFKNNLKNLENIIDKNIYNQKFISNKNNLLSITREYSFIYPEFNRIKQFNNLIENLNVKCFSFKDDDINKNNSLDNHKNIKLNKAMINGINENNDKNKANILGCNINKKNIYK